MGRGLRMLKAKCRRLGDEVVSADQVLEADRGSLNCRYCFAPVTFAQGLGRLLISHVFDMARAFTLQKLVAQMTADQPGAQAAFRRLGFVPEALLADFVVDRNGRSRDLVMMTFDVEGLTDQAGAPVQI